MAHDAPLTAARAQGTTRILLTRVPFFKEIILMAFECPHCGFRNNEVQSGSAIQPRGVRCVLRVRTPADLNRQLVKADTATVLLPELDFEIPSVTQRGSLTTIEGLLSCAADALEAMQPERRAADRELAAKIDAVIAELRRCLRLEREFTLVLDDPSGNSFLENPSAPAPDPAMSVTQYTRTPEQSLACGLRPDGDTDAGVDLAAAADASAPPAIGKDEVLMIPANCALCHSPVEMRMKLVDVPHFKEVLVMSTACDACGHKSSEVKAGGAIGDKGKRITLRMTSVDDLSRDVLKSETAELRIPELGLVSAPGTLGGSFTTVEGLLTQIRDQLADANPFAMGDSASANADYVHRMREFIASLNRVIGGEQMVHMVLDDPAGNSYLQNPCAPSPDPQLAVEYYERTPEQNAELGLDTMQVEPGDSDAHDGRDANAAAPP